MASSARIDPLSWGIRIDESAPNVSDPLIAWKQPRNYPVMRKVLHESIHFWHSVSTDFGIRLAFDSLKSMNALRIAAARGVDLTKIGPDWTLDGYTPFKLQYEAQELSPEGVGLSSLHIFEGLARFWDRYIPTGPSLDELDREMLNETSLYGNAYRLARKELGDFAPICFPVVGYLSLCYEKYDPVLLYVESLKRCSNLIQEQELSLTMPPFDAWKTVWQLAAQGKVTLSRPNAPLTTYQQWMKRLTSWKSRYIEELHQKGDSWIGGHPILEVYANSLFTVLSETKPHLDRSQVELQLPFFCAVPGEMTHYQNLVLRMRPPLVTFSDGQKWVTPPSIQTDVENFSNGLRLFSDMMGAALGFVSHARGSNWKNSCPCTDCPIHNYNLCTSVLEYPESHLLCDFRTEVIKKEFNI